MFIISLLTLQFLFIFNFYQFLKQLGLHPNWQFVDVYGMDPELLSMVPRPVCAVLLLFPITEKYEVFRTEEEEKIKSQGQDVTSSVYFMKQTISNACGTIGLIHAIANNKDKMHFESGSTLKKFLEESVSMSPEERARYLENYDAIRVTHETSAHEGQTETISPMWSWALFVPFTLNTQDSAWHV
ncbi:ubiquitin carboxyl-terminal hydrolase isozyme L3 isoform X5 [Enhydra lutris kenyoni]|uniref:Ubiquitin carboxyl-terminal hydrolase n=1 Tax=Enhydra lutris kenyoni TaxID=391180 RepID=A0A2Y9JL21_ENHLU|nr:ubiquitin carboxyl-terminal hydrolase isozyme L3 isoform X5 [Enhydra lutris kenyoni]